MTTTASIQQFRQLGRALADATDPLTCRRLLRQIAALDPALSQRCGGAAAADAPPPSDPCAERPGGPHGAGPQPAPRHLDAALLLTLAHDLKQPLTAIAMYSDAAAQLVVSGELRAEELVQVLARIDAQVERAAQLLARALTCVGDGQDPPTPPQTPKCP
jgi:hypothetical protein